MIGVVGGGSDGLTFARIIKSADQTVNNSATLVNDSQLLFTINTSKRYYFMLSLGQNSNGTADLKIGWSVPTDSTMLWSIAAGNSEAKSETDTAMLSGGSANLCERIVHGFITTSTTGGTLTLQWAQNTANASDTKVLAGSTFIIWEIA